MLWTGDQHRQDSGPKLSGALENGLELFLQIFCKEETEQE